MRYKDICLNCRKAFNRNQEEIPISKNECPECNSSFFSVNHKFQPPKRNEIKKWVVVEFLVRKGFRYDSFYEAESNGVYQQQGKYPEKMRDAKEFIKQFNIPGNKTSFIKTN